MSKEYLEKKQVINLLENNKSKTYSPYHDGNIEYYDTELKEEIESLPVKIFGEATWEGEKIELDQDIDWEKIKQSYQKWYIKTMSSKVK